MRLFRLTVACATLASLPLPLLAQTPPPAPPAASAAGQPQGQPQGPLVDTIVAKVNGIEIHLSDLNALAQSLPEEARQLPPNQLYPQLLDQAVDGKAIVLMARKQGLDKDPSVSRAMAASSERTLQSALIQRDIGPQVAEPLVKARYEKDLAGKPGEEEVHARHILVPTEDQAKKLIGEIAAGADFATVAKANSTDPAAAQGGDLGFFKSADMLPEFSAMAFSLKPGEVAPTPVQTRYGWHVIKVEERRTAAAPSYQQVHDELRQQMIAEGINKVVTAARGQVKIERFNADGSPVKAPDSATPPPKKP